MIFKNSKVYDVLKVISAIVLPALATLVLTLGDIWGLSYTIPIAATITAVAGFVGAFLKVSSNKYNKELENNAGDVVDLDEMINNAVARAIAGMQQAVEDSNKTEE